MSALPLPRCLDYLNIALRTEMKSLVCVTVISVAVSGCLGFQISMESMSVGKDDGVGEDICRISEF